MTSTAIEKVESHVDRIRSGHFRIKPGQPYRISEAAGVGDGMWQGDLGIEIVDTVPAGFTKVESPADADRQLVPGNTVGSRHCLDSLAGVEIWRPTGWGREYEGLDGPAMVLTSERTVMHPTHGPVTIPAGFTIATRYQREYDAEQQRERRNSD